MPESCSSLPSPHLPCCFLKNDLLAGQVGKEKATWELKVNHWLSIQALVLRARLPVFWERRHLDSLLTWIQHCHNQTCVFLLCPAVCGRPAPSPPQPPPTSAETRCALGATFWKEEAMSQHSEEGIPDPFSIWNANGFGSSEQVVPVSPRFAMHQLLTNAGW